MTPLARPAARGFTLIEAMISITLLALVFALVMDLNRAVRTAYDRVLHPRENVSELLRGYRTFAMDCQNFVNPGFLAGRGTVIDLSQTSGGSGGSGTLSFHTVEYLPAGATEIRLVTYTGGDGVLARTSAPATTVDGRKAADARETYRSVLVTGADNAAFGLFDGANFLKSWQGRRDLPQGVQIRFSTRNGQETWERLFGGAAR